MAPPVVAVKVIESVATPPSRIEVTDPRLGVYDLAAAGPITVPEDMPGVAGIFLGGCILTGPGTSLHRNCRVGGVLAHAHIGSCSERGWICYSNPNHWSDPDHQSTKWHEYAHILANRGHDERWRKAMERLNQPIPGYYLRRTRKAA